MKWLIVLIGGINLWIGVRCLLNAVHILHDSKYGQAATVIFAVVFLAMAAGGFYGSFIKHNDKLALLVSFAPWVVGLLVMLIQMLTGDYK